MWRSQVSKRWIQILVRRYKSTEKYPILDRMRRPKTDLTDEEKGLVNEAVKESGLTGAVHIRLYIDKYYNKTLPYNKVHKHLLKQGLEILHILRQCL